MSALKEALRLRQEQNRSAKPALDRMVREVKRASVERKRAPAGPTKTSLLVLLARANTYLQHVSRYKMLDNRTTLGQEIRALVDEIEGVLK